MLEVEQKFRVGDFDRVRELMLRSGAACHPPHADADHYFNAPDRDFAQTDEALRVRVTPAGAVVTYKGPKRPGVVKTRQEIETPVGDAAGISAVFTALRFRPVAVVRKTRETFTFSVDRFGVTVCLDTADHVGTFVEIEVVADEADAAAAGDVVRSLAAELGLTEPEPRSYLRMLLAAEGRG